MIALIITPYNIHRYHHHECHNMTTLETIIAIFLTLLFIALGAFILHILAEWLIEYQGEETLWDVIKENFEFIKKLRIK